MKKVYKILVLTLILIALVVVGLLPSGVAFADQAFHTMKVLFTSMDEDNYPLKDGFVISTHMNGPVYFEKKKFQLHGAKPDTQFFIYRKIQMAPDMWVLVYSGDSFRTDENGNGHIITNMPPDAPNLIQLKSLGIDHLTLKNVLFDGLLENGGVAAYESETLTTYLDFEWTP